jgi:radical SAM/Cys-rich protein
VSLHSEHHALASAGEQFRILNNASAPLRRFDESLAASGQTPLRSTAVTTLQVNLGKFCNQTCRHCHVDAGPDRVEMMGRAIAEACIEALRHSRIPTLDITGGAPELNPNFRWLVEQARSLGCHVMDRCNLTVLLLRSHAGLAEFLKRHQVEIVASLPYFTEEQHDRQRGNGVFLKSVEALRLLNRLGYGQPDSPLLLNLVYNPSGAYMPPSQAAAELDFKRELDRRHGITFHRLYTMANLPISRFLEFLIRTGNYQRYMSKLVQAYNPAAAAAVMCRHTISVAWDGTLHDCDFNQMLELPLTAGLPRRIQDIPPEEFARCLGNRTIATGQHCYGCTAGCGSSCGGAVVS